MVEIVFIACLVAEPTACERKRAPFGETSVAACSLEAQFRLSQWSNRHPKWTIKRWRCRVQGVEGDA